MICIDKTGSWETSELSGLFVTNCTKSFYELTGKVQLKKADAYTSSRLMRFLEKESNGAVAATAVK